MSISNVFKIRILVIVLFFGPLFSRSIVYFSPKDKISSKLIDQIKQTKNKIHAAVYMLTDKKIANALIEAKRNKNIDVQIITDSSSLKSEFNKIELLKDNGIDVFLYKPKTKKNNSRLNEIMHNKFAIFDNKVWTGSFNWTVSAGRSNRENVICVQEDAVCKRYEKEFEKLKRRCVLSSPEKNKNNNNNNLQNADINLKATVYKLLKSIKDRFQINGKPLGSYQ